MIRSENKLSNNDVMFLKSWKTSNDFDIINFMSEYVALVYFVYNIGNVHNSITIYGVWIFGVYYKILLPLLKNNCIWYVQCPKITTLLYSLIKSINQ